jgi:hypothetical protein
MTIIRMRYRFAGGHIHVRVFTAKSRTATFAKAGDLIFTESEWPTVRLALESRQIEVLRDDEDAPSPPRLSRPSRLILLLWLLVAVSWLLWRGPLLFSFVVSGGGS